MNPMPHEQAGPQVPWVMPWNSEGLSHESVRRSVELASMTSADSGIGEPDPLTLREDLRHRDSDGFRRRRAIVALSVLGLVSSALVTLYQMGLVRHLPDSPVRRFQSDKGNASCSSYQYGMPGAMLPLATHAANILFAGLGTHARYRETPWIPIVAGVKAAAEAGVAVKRLDLQAMGRPWCGYSLIDAVTRLGAAMLALPEAFEAIRHGLIVQSSDRRVL